MHYSCLHSFPTTLPCPTHPHLPPSISPPHCLCPGSSYTFLDLNTGSHQGMTVCPPVFDSSWIGLWFSKWKKDLWTGANIHLLVAVYCHWYSMLFISQHVAWCESLAESDRMQVAWTSHCFCVSASLSAVLLDQGQNLRSVPTLLGSRFRHLSTLGKGSESAAVRWPQGHFTLTKRKS